MKTNIKRRGLNMKILVVDDDQIASDLLKSCLNEAGLSDLTFASSAEDAEGYIENSRNQFECILLDIAMPEKDGITLCREIRQKESYLTIPIIMITSMKDAGSIEQAFAKGATDYITKPYQFSDVVTRIGIAHRAVAERRAALNSLELMRTSERSYKLRANGNTRRSATVDQSVWKVGGDVDALSNLEVLENIITRMVQAEGCEIGVIGIRVESLDASYTSLTQIKRDSTVTSLLESLISYSTGYKVFLSYVGDGTFVAASDQVRYSSSEVIEQEILNEMRVFDQLSGHPELGYPEIAVGQPIQLLSASRLNFDRLVKVVKARVNARVEEKTVDRIESHWR